MIIQNELVYVNEPQRVDHVFVVLNRPDSSDVTRWFTWGSSTIILDPWINRVFTAPNFFHEWGQINSFGRNPRDWEPSGYGTKDWHPLDNSPSSWRIRLKFNRTQYWG